jgi:hypothetical protein
MKLSVRLAIKTIAVLAPRRGLDDTSFFVESDGLRRYARAIGRFADVQIARSYFLASLVPVSCKRRSNSAFDTTLTEESAMAAAAIIGLKTPAAASGIPTTL